MAWALRVRGRKCHQTCLDARPTDKPTKMSQTTSVSPAQKYSDPYMRPGGHRTIGGRTTATTTPALEPPAAQRRDQPAGLAAVSPPSSTDLPITERGARTGRLLVICSEGLNEGVDVVHSTCDFSIAQPLASPMVIPKVNFLAIGVGKRDYRDLTTVVRATETPVDG